MHTCIHTHLLAEMGANFHSNEKVQESYVYTCTHTYIHTYRAIAEMEAKFQSNDEVRETEVRKLREELFALKTFKERCDL